MDEHRGLARERKTLTHLPVIDLAPFVGEGSADERRAVAKSLREACIDIGFFYLGGHGSRPGQVFFRMNLAIDQLQDSDDFAAAIFHRERQQRTRPVAGFLVVMRIEMIWPIAGNFSGVGQVDHLAVES